MSEWEDLYRFGQSLAYCLTAVNPELSSSLFAQATLSNVSIESGDSSTRGLWYHALRGFMFIGPEGGAHYYTPEAPTGVSPDEIHELNVKIDDKLVQELDSFLAKVRLASDGQPVQFETHDGKRATFRASGDELTRVKAFATMLDGVCQACDRNFNPTLTQQLHLAILQKMSESSSVDSEPAESLARMFEAAAAAVLELRQHYGVDVRPVALFVCQAQLCGSAAEWVKAGKLQPTVLYRLAGMAAESATCGHDPEQSLGRTVADFSNAGLGDLVLRVCDESLTAAQSSVEAALNAGELTTYADNLYNAAPAAFASMRLAQALSILVPVDNRPAGATDNILNGYALNAEEIVVRVGHALLAHCINTESGEMLDRHRAHVASAREKGGEKEAKRVVHELISDYYFYPRYYANELLGDTK